MAKEKKEGAAETTIAAVEAASETTAESATNSDAAVTPETWEEKQARLAREDYARRNAEEMKAREAILRANGDLQPDESLNMDPQAALDAQCCL